MLETLLCLALIDNLGHKNYHTRDQASKFLSALSFQHYKLISEFANDRNAERARRIQDICSNGLTGQITYAVGEIARKEFYKAWENACGPNAFGPVPVFPPIGGNGSR